MATHYPDIEDAFRFYVGEVVRYRSTHNGSLMAARVMSREEDSSGERFYQIRDLDDTASMKEKAVWMPEHLLDLRRIIILHEEAPKRTKDSLASIPTSVDTFHEEVHIAGEPLVPEFASMTHEEAHKEAEDPLVSDFASMIYNDTRCFPYLPECISLLVNRFPTLLEEFSFSVTPGFGGEAYKDGVSFVYQNANSITLSFLEAMRSSLLSQAQTDGGEIEELKKHTAILLHILAFQINEFVTHPAQHLGEEERHPPNVESTLSIRRSFQLAKTTKGYEGLLERIRAIMSLTFYCSPGVAAVRNSIEDIVNHENLDAEDSAAVISCCFTARGNLRAFLDFYFGSSETKGLQLESVITLTSCESNVQAATIKNYMEQTWPVTGSETLAALQEALLRSPYQSDVSDGRKVRCTINRQSFVLDIVSTKLALIETGEQLAWLCAAMGHHNPTDDTYARLPTVSTAQVASSTHETRSSKTNTFNIEVTFRANNTRNLQDKSSTCWRELFLNPVIVDGWPIPTRMHGEVGLEIPLDLMAELGNANYFTDFCGIPVLKGFSTMFVATSFSKDSVQWHFLCNPDGTRLSYNDALPHCQVSPPGSSIPTGARNFVGWTSSVRRLAGTQNARYDEICWSKLDYCGSGYALTRASLNAGKYVTAGLQVGRGIRNRRILDMSDRYYDEAINFMRQHVRVNLYDVADRRGWLLDGASAVLHLSRTQLSHHESPHNKDAQVDLSLFQHASCDHGAEAAVFALRANRDLVLNQSTMETCIETKDEGDSEIVTTRTTKLKLYRFEDLVKGNLSLVEKMHDFLNLLMDIDGLEIPAFGRENLEGWDFVEIVSGEKSLKPRVYKLNCPNGGWIDFTRRIHAVNIFAQGFGEMLEPASESDELCHWWAHVPKQEDFLSVCVSTLDEICRRYGDSQMTPFKLAHDIYWYKGSLLFEKCGCRTKAERCDRVQELLPFPMSKLKGRPEPFKKPNGAVIFGRSRAFPLEFPNRGPPREEITTISIEPPGDEPDLSKALNGLVQNGSRRLFGRRT